MPVPDLHHEHHDTDPPTTTEQQAAGQLPGWQWASLVAVLIGGQAVLLVLTTWTLATAFGHGWVLPILLALGLLARLVPDTLKLAEWAAAAHSWTPPVDRHLHLAVAIAALMLANLVAIAA